jgi:hypothetical protein
MKKIVLLLFLVSVIVPITYGVNYPSAPVMPTKEESNNMQAARLGTNNNSTPPLDYLATPAVESLLNNDQNAYLNYLQQMLSMGAKVEPSESFVNSCPNRKGLPNHVEGGVNFLGKSECVVLKYSYENIKYTKAKCK